MAEDQQKMDLKELEMKHAADHTSVSLSTLLKERDELLEFHAEVRRTFQNIRESMQKMSVENKRVANHLREQLGTLEQGRKTLLKRKLLPEITMNETANFVTDKIVSKLEEDEKKGAEKLQKKHIELRKKLNSKRAMKQEPLN